MARTLLAFVPVAVLVTITPGPATAMVVRSAAGGGRRSALACTAGNSLGVLAWGALAAAGLAAAVATSVTVFTVVKLVGAVVLIVLGVQSLRHRPGRATGASDGRAFRDGLVTSVSNPKLAVFYVALFPQFLPAGAPVLPSAMLMAATIVAFDLVWYSVLAYGVTRARRAFLEGPWAGRVERLTGAVLASGGGDAGRLAAVLRRAPLLMEALRVARGVGAPDWLVSAGAIRDAVWDAAHGRPPTAAPRDIDVGFFDSSDLTPERDEAVEAALRAGAPDLPWDAKNQAAVHLWYPRVFGMAVPPFRSTAEAVATFPETASCVGVRLLHDDDLLVVAPYGLGDLLACVCRHNPARVPPDFYERRVEERRWAARWPRMRYVGPAERPA